MGNPQTGETQNPEWKQRSYTICDSSLQLAENASTEPAKRYSENSSVIFELFNKPAPIAKKPLVGASGEMN